MRFFIRQHRLMLSLLGPVVLAGCHLGDSRQAVPQPASAAAANKTPAQPTLAMLTQPAYGGTTTATLVSYGTMEAAPPPATDHGATNNVKQATLVTRQPATPPPAVVQVPVQVTPAPPAEPYAYGSADLPPARSLYPRGETTQQRKSFADITAHASFGHAPDYSWISGEATRYRSEWRLRFASVDEIDAHGGSLVLIGNEQVDKLKDGEHFKLVGHIDPQGSKAGGEAFYVEAVEAAE